MELLNFINSHSDWEEILTDSPYHIKISRDGEYILFKYNQLASDFSESIVRECRGCIVRQGFDGMYHVVCHPFDKFGNYGESYAPELEGNLTVLEKIDGSLIKCWWDNGQFHVSTNGTINAYNAPLYDGAICKSFGELAELAVMGAGMTWGDFMAACEKGYTWMFELVSPYSRVVVPYRSTEMFLLGRRNMETGVEEDPYQFEGILREHFDVPKKYEINTLKDAIEISERMNWDTEGFVVHDDFFNRVKVKSPEYIKAHYLRGNGVVTWRRLIEIVINGEEEEFLNYCDDYVEALEKVKMEYEELHAISLLNSAGVSLFLEDNKECTRREVAEFIQMKCPKCTQVFCFALLDNPDLVWPEWIKEKNINFVERLFDTYEKEYNIYG